MKKFTVFSSHNTSNRVGNSLNHKDLRHVNSFILVRFLAVIAISILLNLPASAQMERLEQLRRGGNTADLFRGQTPPPGAVTVLGPPLSVLSKMVMQAQSP